MRVEDEDQDDDSKRRKYWKVTYHLEQNTKNYTSGAQNWKVSASTREVSLPILVFRLQQCQPTRRPACNMIFPIAFTEALASEFRLDEEIQIG